MAQGDYNNYKTKCRPKNPCEVLRNLVELMTHPISEKATNRQLGMIADFLNASHYAFWLQDIPYIIRLYEAIIKRLDQVPEFKKALECLLYFSAFPPMLTKRSDMIEYARDLQEYFSVLGYLIICLHDETLSRAALNAITSLLDPQSPVGYCCIPLDNIKEAAEKSKLPEILAQLLYVISDDLYPILLNATFLVCEISKFACQKIARENAIEFLLQRLEPSWKERDLEIKPSIPNKQDSIPNVEDTCAILWKLLCAIDKTKVQTPSVYALWSLQYAFRWSTVNPVHKLDRNNFAGIILKLLTTFPDLAFVESELADDIAVLARTSKGYTCHANSEFVQGYLDFQFKKIIWACLHFFKQFKADKIIKHNNIIKSFTKFLSRKEAKTKDCIQQYCELTKIVLKIIPKYLEASVLNFTNFNGPLTMVRLLEKYLQIPLDIEVLEAYLYCLHEILVLEIDDVTVLFDTSHTVVASVCSKLLSTTTLTLVHQKCLARCFCILQIFVTAGFVDDPSIIDLCIIYLNRVRQPNENDPVLDPKITVCALTLLWEIIKTIHHVSGEFLRKGGIYILLDITELCSFTVKSLSLGVLADISKMSASVPYLITWRKRGQKLIPMLMEIFRGLKNTQCDDNNEDENKSSNNWMGLCRGQKITFQNCCITRNEILKRCRCKIHGILYSLKVKFKDKVDFTNDHYKVYSEKLNTDDELTMLFAEHFLSLTMCDLWMTIAKELATEETVLVENDSDHLTDKIQRIRQWKSFLRYKIENIVKQEAHYEQTQENETYILLNEARLSDALDALTELRFQSNCTERVFQMTKKLRLNQDVEALRHKISNYHTTITNLPFTNIYNQTVNIESNIIYDTKKEIFDIDPVSLDENIDLESDDSEDNLIERPVQC